MDKTTILNRVASGELKPEAAAVLLRYFRTYTKSQSKTNKPDFLAIYEEANQAGMVAASACMPTPMVVQQHSNQMDDNSSVVKQWVVPAGVCGFAWIQFPGNTAWAKWCKAKGYAREAYPKGYSIWVHQFNQSMELKEAYGYAFAEVLRKHGIRAYCGSRMD
jgi:hypothetical protein